MISPSTIDVCLELLAMVQLDLMSEGADDNYFRLSRARDELRFARSFTEQSLAAATDEGIPATDEKGEG